MLRSVKSLEGFAIGATDGAIGKVKDFYFDDEAWVVRYVVVNTSAWLGDREVLISPQAIGEAGFGAEILPVNVTKEQVKKSPGIDTNRPISRQFEKNFLGYYGYPYYWSGAASWGEGKYPGTLLTGVGPSAIPAYLGYLRAPSEHAGHEDAHLRSCQAVKGYHVHAKDGEVGHIEGMIIDDRSWSIRYLVVNTSNWWIGHQVLVSPERIQYVSWVDSQVGMDLDRRSIQDAPKYEGNVTLDRAAVA